MQEKHSKASEQRINETQSNKKVVIDKNYPFLDGHVVVSWLDQRGSFASVNQSLLDMSGYQETDLIGASYTLLKHPEIPDAVYEELRRKLDAGKRWKGLIKVLRKDGAYFWGLTTIMPIQYQQSSTRYLCTVRKPSSSQVSSHKEKYLMTNKAG